MKNDTVITRYGTFKRPTHGRVTLGQAMKMLDMDPLDRKRDTIKEMLTKYKPNPLLSKYLVYSWDEVINLIRQQAILEPEEVA